MSLSSPSNFTHSPASAFVPHPKNSTSTSTSSDKVEPNASRPSKRSRPMEGDSRHGAAEAVVALKKNKTDSFQKPGMPEQQLVQAPSRNLGRSGEALQATGGNPSVSNNPEVQKFLERFATLNSAPSQPKAANLFVGQNAVSNNPEVQKFLEGFAKLNSEPATVFKPKSPLWNMAFRGNRTLVQLMLKLGVK